MSKLVLAMNLKNSAVTQYTGYDLNGCATDHEKQPWGANENGIFKLEEPNHDEAQIDAYFILPTTDLAAPNQKRIRSVLAGGEAENDLLFSMACDGDDYQEFTQTIDKTDLSQAGAKCHGRRDQKGRYWKFKIANQNGADFSVDSISVFPVLLRNKPGRR